VHGLKRILASQITIDESTAIALAHESKSESDARTGFWLTGGGIYLFWNLATLIGALGANALGDPAKWGLDATIPAAFLGLLWPRLTSTSSKVVAVAAVALALLLTPLLTPGLPIIACALIPLIVGWQVRS
jgi:predicted branched-subunit amino acid permease